MRPEQTVEEMAEEVLVRQAKALVDRTGQPFETSLESVAETEAGRQLRELANSAYSEERAADWQDSLPWQRDRGTPLLVAGELHGVVGRQGGQRRIPRGSGGGTR